MSINNLPTPEDEPDERLVEQALCAALRPVARPMSRAQIDQVVALAAQRASIFPVWVILAWALLLGGLAYAGVSLPGLPDPVRTLAVALPASNLIAAPIASLAIIIRRRKPND
ncbi:MAG TPA: hypothetical protein VHO48_08200 [Anaerolineaceae bacterium]|nr:hypothetical protein [Anaerolineaceae bacterium]